MVFWFHSLFRIHALCFFNPSEVLSNFMTLSVLCPIVFLLPWDGTVLLFGLSCSVVLCYVCWLDLGSNFVLSIWCYFVTRIGQSVSSFPLPRWFCTILGLCSYLNMWLLFLLLLFLCILTFGYKLSSFTPFPPKFIFKFWELNPKHTYY